MEVTDHKVQTRTPPFLLFIGNEMEVKITGDQIKELLNELPQEARKALEMLLSKIASSAPLGIIKNWIENFEESCSIDKLLAMIISPLIIKIPQSIDIEVCSLEKQGINEYTNIQALRAAIKELRKLADHLELHANDPSCETCTTKH